MKLPRVFFPPGFLQPVSPPENRSFTAQGRTCAAVSRSTPPPLSGGVLTGSRRALQSGWVLHTFSRGRVTEARGECPRKSSDSTAHLRPLSCFCLNRKPDFPVLTIVR